MNTLRATFKFVGILVIMSLGTVFSASTAGFRSDGGSGVVRGGGVGVAVAGVVSGGSGSAVPMRGPGVDSTPTEGIIYYIPLSAREPLPWRCNDQALLRQAIDESSLGRVPEQAPNVFYVSDAWADRIKRTGKCFPGRLYYVIEGDSEKELMFCSDQSFLRDLIKECGCKHVPGYAANVFYIKEEWRTAIYARSEKPFTTSTSVIRGLDETKPVPLFFIVKGASNKIILSYRNRSVVKKALVDSGWEHATGQDANVYYISPHAEALLRQDAEKNKVYFLPEGWSPHFYGIDAFLRYTYSSGSLLDYEKIRNETNVFDCSDQLLLWRLIYEAGYSWSIEDKVFYIKLGSEFLTYAGHIPYVDCAHKGVEVKMIKYPPEDGSSCSVKSKDGSGCSVQ